LGSISNTENECLGSNIVCPEGSTQPKFVSNGYYTVNQSIAILCEPGYYCLYGIKYMCDEGFYGLEYGLSSKTCSGLCQEGYYCPYGSTQSNEKPCGNSSVYCPTSSSAPLSVNRGYYTVGGADETTRTNEVIAPLGRYSVSGILYDCDGGYYGDSPGQFESICSGKCTEGYYCPPGSSISTSQLCGGDNFYCPKGSALPQQVPRGYHTANYLIEPCGPGTWRNLTLSVDPSIVNKSAITTSLLIPYCSLCPSKTFKTSVGDDLSLCQPCRSKYSNSSDDRLSCICARIVSSNQRNYFNYSTGFCEILSIHEFQLASTKNNLFLIWGSNNSLTRYEITLCEPGSYCVDGIKYICPSGTFGSNYGEISSSCSGLCSPGYYCTEGSTNPRASPCGAPNLFCSIGSSSPTFVSSGYFGINDDGSTETTRISVQLCYLGYYCPGDGYSYPCPAGQYGDLIGLSACSGECSGGYYCPLGSASPTQYQCGNTSVYCTRGSSTPQTIHPGFYGIYTGIDSSSLALWDPNNTTFSAEIPC
jgi:hypothetical protein